MPLSDAASLPSRADVVRILRAVNDHWVATHPDPGHNRWDRATYFSGDLALHRLVGERRYRGYAERWAAAQRWGLHGGPATRHADNQCAGQAYLDLYELRPEPRRIAAIERSVRNMVYGPDKNDDSFWSRAWSGKGRSSPSLDRFCTLALAAAARRSSANPAGPR
jgi:unsaturated rhamnogalacturonyl hydrolase